MGESYKGLTIRIGADTSNLQKSLKSVSASIRTTQNQLSRIGKGLKFDSSDVSLISKRMELLGDKLVETSHKMARLREAKEQFESSSGLKKQADSVKNIAYEVERSRRAYADSVAAVATLNNKLESMAKLNGVAFDKKHASAYISSLVAQKVITQELADEHKKLVMEMLRLDSVHKDNRKIAEYKDLQVEIAATAAEAKNLAAQYVNARRSMSVLANSQSFENLSRKTEETEESMQRLRQEAQMLDRALSFDPSNVDLLGMKMKNAKDQGQALNAKIENLKEHLKELEGAEMQSLVREFKESGKSVEQVDRELEEAKRSATEFAAKLELAKDHLNSLLDSKGALASDIEKASDAVEDLAVKSKKADAALEKAERAYNGAHAQGEVRKVKTEIAAASAEARSFSNAMRSSFNLGSYGAKMRSFSAALQTSITPAIMMMGQSFIQSAEDIDSAYRDMRKTVEGTEEQFEALKQSAMETASQSIVSADTILEIEAMGGQLGLAVTELDTFSRVISNLDIATNIDADTAAQELGKLSGILGMTESDFESFGDALVRLGNNTPALESDIMEITTRFGSMGNIVGMTADEMLAWSTAITAAGVKAEAGGSSMQRTLSNIQGFISDDGEALQEFAKISGTTVDSIKSQWGKEGGASNVMQEFVNGLKRMKDNGEDVDGALQSLGITGVRDKQMLEGLTNTTDTLSDALQMSRNAWDGVSDQWGNAGDAANEAEKKTAGFSGSLGILKNNMQNLGSVVGDALVPFIDDLSGAIKMLTQWFSGLDSGTQHAVISMVGFAAALGPTGNIIGATAQVLGAWSKKAVEVAQNAGHIAPGVENASRAFKSLSAAQKASALASAAASTAMMGFLAVAAVGLSMVIMDYMKFRSEQKQLTESTRNLAEALGVTSGSIKASGNSAASAKSQYQDLSRSALDVADAEQRLADSINDIKGEAIGNIGVLESYKDTISELGFKTNRSESETARLKMALDGLNESAGTKYYIDEATGAIMEEGKEAAVTRESLMNLADAQKAAAQSAAWAEMYKESYKEYARATQDYNKALENRNRMEMDGSKWVQRQTVEYDRFGNAFIKTEEVLSDAWLKNESALKENLDLIQEVRPALDGMADNAAFFEMAKNVDSMAAKLNQFGDVVSSLEGRNLLAPLMNDLEALGVTTADVADWGTKEWGALASAYNGSTSDISSALKRLGIDCKTNAEMMADYMNGAGSSIKSALDGAGVSVDEFIAALDKGGVSVDALADMGADAFMALGESCDWNVQDMIAALQGLDQQQLSGKDVTVDMDDSQYQADKASIEGEHIEGGTVSIESDTSGVDQGTAQAQSEVNSVQQSSPTRIDVNNSSAMQKINQTKTALGGIKDKPVKISFSAPGLSDIKSTYDNIVSKSITITTHKKEVKDAAGGIARFAAGGIADTPGVFGLTPQILNRATLTSRGIAGEAGAEAIIPLTNRHYVRPFARAVAEEMAQFTQGTGNQVVYNLSINGAQVNSSAEIQDACMTLLKTVNRKYRMG